MASNEGGVLSDVTRALKRASEDVVSAQQSAIKVFWKSVCLAFQCQLR
jgi:hypothetical protein